MWSVSLKEAFTEVHAFEPIAAHRECFEKNVHPDGCRVILYPYALGEKDTFCSMHTTDGSSGDSWVKGDGDIPVRRLDDFDINPDFIKLDCEGYEYFALKGGEEMLKRCRPTIIVEQKPGKAQHFGLQETQAVTYLESLGWKLKDTISGDYILAFKTP